MSRNAVIGAVAVVAVVILGWYYLKSQQAGVSYTKPSKAPSVKTTQPTVPPATSTASPTASSTIEKNVVTINSSGFSPKNITIKAGETVTWVNGDTKNHQVQSAIHPTHQLYPPLNSVGLLKSGEKKSLTFPNAGTYKYHDHLNPSFTGSVTVK